MNEKESFVMQSKKDITRNVVLKVGDKIVIIKFQCDEDIISMPRPCLSDHMSAPTWMLGKTLFSSPSGLNTNTSLARGLYLPSHVIQNA